MWAARVAVLVATLAFVMPVCSGMTLESEKMVPLDFVPTAMTYDSERKLLWVGGNKEGSGNGIVAFYDLKKKAPKAKVIGTCGNQIFGVSSSVVKGKLLFGMPASLCVVDAVQRTVQEKALKIPDPEFMEIRFIYLHPNADKVLLAFRKATKEVDNWCFNQEFSFPALTPNWGAFSGRHPGPCKGMAVDVERDKVYFCDAAVRGRWDSISNAASRYERQWNNFRYIEGCDVFGDTAYFLLRSGRVDGFDLDKYGADEPAKQVSIDLGDRTSFELWSLMAKDIVRGGFWVGSEDGELVFIKISSSAKTGMRQAGIYQTKKAHRYGQGLVLPSGTLAVLDTSDEHPGIVLLSFANDCPYGSTLFCDCFKKSSGIQSCSFGSSHTVAEGSKLLIPPNTELHIAGDLVIGKGATLVLPMDSKVIVKGKVSFAGAHVALTSLDRSQGPGTISVLEGNFDEDTFASVKVELFQMVKRVATCFQLPRLGVTLHPDKLEVAVAFSGMSSCASPIVVFVVWLAAIAGIAAGVYYGFLVRTVEEERKREL